MVERNTERVGSWPTKIASLATYVPPKILSNADLEKMVETSDDWIMQRVGIRERHIVDKGMATSDLAVEAANEALKQRGWASSDLEAQRCRLLYGRRRRGLRPGQRRLINSFLPQFAVSIAAPAGMRGAHSHGIISGPGIVHTGVEDSIFAGTDRRPGMGVADGLQRHSVPVADHRIRRRGPEARSRSDDAVEER